MIQITDKQGNKFYINETLIERILPTQYSGGSEIQLTTGRWVSCGEDAKQIVELIDEVNGHIK